MQRTRVARQNTVDMNDAAAVRSACSRGMHPLLAANTRGGSAEMDAVLMSCTHHLPGGEGEVDFDEAERLIASFVADGGAPAKTATFAAAVNATVAIREMRDAHAKGVR